MGVECSRNVASGRKVAGAIRFLVDATDRTLSVLYSCMKHCLYMFLCMLWKEKERVRIRVIQMDNLRGLLGIRGMDRVPHARIRMCGVMKGIDERIDEGVLRWFAYVEG